MYHHLQALVLDDKDADLTDEEHHRCCYLMCERRAVSVSCFSLQVYSQVVTHWRGVGSNGCADLLYCSISVHCTVPVLHQILCPNIHVVGAVFAAVTTLLTKQMLFRGLDESPGVQLHPRIV